jgi:putative Holliday junction resolvase
VRALGLDVGERRVGIAISDPTGTVVRPLRTLIRSSRAEDFAVITALVAEHNVELVVVGQPLSLDGSEGPQARRISRYAQRLADQLTVPIVFWDERYTTVAAEEIMLQNRSKGKRRRARAEGGVDAIAAAVILQSYLDSQDKEPEIESGE